MAFELLRRRRREENGKEELFLYLSNLFFYSILFLFHDCNLILYIYENISDRFYLFVLQFLLSDSSKLLFLFVLDIEIFQVRVFLLLSRNPCQQAHVSWWETNQLTGSSESVVGSLTVRLPGGESHLDHLVGELLISGSVGHSFWVTHILQKMLFQSLPREEAWLPGLKGLNQGRGRWWMWCWHHYDTLTQFSSRWYVTPFFTFAWWGGVVSDRYSAV